MKRCRLRFRRRKGASRERSRRAPGLEAIIRSKRTGARRPCPVVAKRPAGSVFEPMKGSTMNALTKTTEHQARSRKMYTGRRGPQGCVVWAIDGNGERKPSTRARSSATTALPASNGDMAGAGRRSWRSPFWQNTSATMTLR
jgi:hypothetical protein